MCKFSSELQKEVAETKGMLVWGFGLAMASFNK
jgi:hypothetical protein